MVKLLLLPAVRLMGRLRFVWKFGLISSLFLLPLLVLGWGVVAKINQQMQQVASERQGLIALQDIYATIRVAEQYRDLSTITRASQDETLRHEVEAQKTQVDEQLAHLQLTLLSLNSEFLNKRFEDVQELWLTLHKNSSGAQGGVRTQFQYFDEFVQVLRGLIADAASASKLVLDPELETFLLINVFTQHLFHGTENMGIARAMGAYALNQKYLSSEIYEEMDKVYVGLGRDNEVISGSFAYIAETDPRLLKKLQADIDSSLTSMMSLQLYLSENIIEATELNIDWREYFQNVSGLMDGVYHLADILMPFTDKLLQQRQTKLEQKLFLMGIFTLGLLLFIFYLFAGMYYSVTRTVRQFSSDALRATQGDLTVVMQEETNDELRQLSAAFNHMIRNIREVVILVKGTSLDVVALSDTLSHTTDMSREAIKRQQQDTHDLTTEIESVAHSTEQIVQQTGSNTALAKDINEKSQQGLHKLEQALAAIQGLAKNIGDSSSNIQRLADIGKEIEGVLAGIKAIADQTNLLALNAAIEAARAGEAGRGFAVVADEVRNLASNTVNSTEEINDKISRFNACINEVVACMEKNQQSAQRTINSSDEVAHSLREIHQSAQDIQQSSLTIARDAQQQNAMTHNANQHILTIDHAVGQSMKVVDNVVRVSREFNSLTQQLSMLVGRFQVDGALELPAEESSDFAHMLQAANGDVSQPEGDVDLF
ncbi:MAG: HAMP domain-containing protein [Oceanospirillaceae bacterium]|nr:HAMP domain-containing protein [Oceanospirillaceae bacterium]